MSELKWLKTREKGLLKASTSGRYYYRLHAGGRQHWGSLDTTDFKIAGQRLRKKVEEIKGAGSALANVNTGRGTVGHLIEIFQAAVKNNTGKNSATKHFDGQQIAVIKRTWPELSGLRIRDIDKAMVEDWAANRLRTEKGGEYSANRFNTCIDTLRNILEIGVENGVIAKNPVNGLGKRIAPPDQLVLPTSEQFAKLLETLRGTGVWCSQQYADLVAFLAYTGARISEARGCLWEHVEAENIVFYGKGRGGVKKMRRVPITPALRLLLDDLKANKRHYRGNRENHVLALTEVDRALKAACKKLNLQPLSNHDFRDYFATRAIEGGADLFSLQKWLGHKKIDLIVSTYGHLTDEHSQMLAAKITF
jgi:integrase